ncbi:EamA family transporter RarD [Solimonas soli]|uniref:EamA family transporter RarD n=1 Tax=Solimonas soli TaxID=413479 RepID=UPI00047F87B8|nr:EamA family transporter RarD [Solimonas soli]
MREGLVAATAAYLIWGLFPLYWRLLHAVPATQIMAHRIAWSAAFVAAWLAAREGWAWLRGLSPRLLAMLAASSLLIACNWWLYIWAVNAGHVVDASLGYFINPLFSVLLGVGFLRERLNAAQWLAVALAAASVVWLGASTGHVPWVALGIAASFGGYGLLRKLAVVPAVQGLAIETALLFVPALAYLLWAEHAGVAGFAHLGRGVDAGLILGGLVTAVPLALFAHGARRVPLSLIGILQYLTPSMQLVIGVLLYGEPFGGARALGFAGIWAALVLFALDGLLRSRRAVPTA